MGQGRKQKQIFMKKKSFFLTAVATLSLATATIAQNVPSYVPTNGLVGWWPFNGNANDESGNNNNGTVNGATLTTDRFGNAGKAYSFDGVNDDISANRVFQNSFSFSGWYYLNLNQQFSPIIDAYNANWEILIESLQPTFVKWISPPASYQELFTTIFNNTNQWYHIVCTYSGNQVTVYSNGNLIKIFTNVTLPNNNGSYYFGKSFSGLPQYLNGKLDDIGIWNRALTQQEITDLYNANICYQTVTVTDTLIINTNLVGFNPITYQNTIKIFPNPTSDHITINYGNYATLSGYQLKIINSLGQQLFQTAINQQSSYINLSNWTGNGIYFVQIIDPQGNIIDIRKIVLQ